MLLFKNFSIIFLSLITFVSNGIAQMPFEVPENDTCFINLYPEHANRFSPSSLEVDLHYDHLSPMHGTEAPLADNTIRLEFILRLQQYNYGRAMPIQISSVAESRNFQGHFSMPLFSISEGVTVIDVIREAIKNGYRELRDVLGTQFCLKRSLVNTISAIEGDRIEIPLGQIDNVRVGDVFHIYPREYYESLIDMPYLATGIVIKTDDTTSMLEVYAARIGEVQVGDVVAPDSSIDFASRTLEQRSEPHYLVETLQLGRIPRIFVRFVDNNGVRAREEITSIIRELLVREAPPFGFQVRL